MTIKTAKIKDFTKEAALYKEAFEAAVDAAAKYETEHPGEWFPCGFAWVRIKPARGKFVEYLKSLEEKTGRIGYTDTYEGGFVVYNPSQNPTQAMYVKAAGANAFRDVLIANGIRCTAETRVD